ncbi:MAG: molecular chaperone DnaJ [Proteobacteria bacterium]|nr:molecular chaperone DnaJ [Pseudomonadota bacterium]
MKNDITRSKTPEEQEFSRKLSELDELETELAQRELDLATFQAELHTFETRYLRTVGARYAELDEIQAQIAEAETQIKPKDKKIQEQAAQARAKAKESAQAAWITEEPREEKFKPSESLKKLYRELAKCIHPDLAVDEKERLRRQKLMADANRAYEEGDEVKLKAILAEWESSPESVKGEGIAVDLVRVIRKIAQVKKRLGTIETEIAHLGKSDLYKLKTKAEKAEDVGRDLLAEMALRVDKEVVLASKCLTEMTRRRGHT